MMSLAQVIKKKENRNEQVESHAIAMAADFDNTAKKTHRI